MKTKKILAIATVATTLTAFIVSCTKEKLDDTHPKPQTLNAEVATTEKATIQHTIPLDAVKSMISAYEHKRLVNNPDDPRSGWFSLRELSSFIEDVKISAKNSGVNPDDAGVRIYFTVYPDQQSGESSYFRSIENEYRNKLSFVMLPTFRDPESNSQKDVLQVEGSNERLSQGFMSPSGAGTVALNHAALCPPNCPTKGGSGGSFIPVK